MPLEIERKFLLASAAWRGEVSRRQPMAQGYLVGVGGKSSIRVRVAGDEARLNIKAAVIGASRAEFDYGIPLDEGKTLLATLTVGTVEKPVTSSSATGCSGKSTSSTATARG